MIDPGIFHGKKSGNILLQDFMTCLFCIPSSKEIIPPRMPPEYLQYLLGRTMFLMEVFVEIKQKEIFACFWSVNPYHVGIGVRNRMLNWYTLIHLLLKCTIEIMVLVHWHSLCTILINES